MILYKKKKKKARKLHGIIRVKIIFFMAFYVKIIFMKHIGVFTSGGDAPGMNAAVRAAVRTALSKGLQITGIERGYQGIVDNCMQPMDGRSVSNIIHRGGTILKTSRCKDFLTEEGRKKAAANLDAAGIEGLVAIGGNGTFTGLTHFSQWSGAVIGVPGTIDNDLFGTDYTIGYDTAVNTALDAIDKIRDTAEAHDRTFLIEVMGRSAGFIALDVGVAGGAEEILIPEIPTDLPAMCERLEANMKKGKTSNILVVAEGDDAGGAEDILKTIPSAVSNKTRASILGYIQRGGSPTAADRILATRLGHAAVEALLEGKTGIMAGVSGQDIVYVPLQDAINRKKELNLNLLDMNTVLAR